MDEQVIAKRIFECLEHCNDVQLAAYKAYISLHYTNSHSSHSLYHMNCYRLFAMDQIGPCIL